MATVYNINVKTVSAFKRYREKDINKIFSDFLETYRDEKTGLKFESTVVDTKIEH